MPEVVVAFIVTIEDEFNQPVAELTTGHEVYLLRDGKHLLIPTTPAWCQTCHGFEFAESMESPEVREAFVRKYHKIFRSRSRNFFLRWPEAILDWIILKNRLREIAKWRRVWAVRKSPARCLTCGKHQVIAIPQDGSWVAHPGVAGQKIRVRADYHHVELDDERGRIFTTEGVLIPGRLAPWP